MMPSSTAVRLERALCALEGLSVGDAFGERFFHTRIAVAQMWLQDENPLRDLNINELLGPPPWRWTDDTAMAVSIVATLRDQTGIDPSRLALDFATRHAVDPLRGYGPAMHTLLPRLQRPDAWQTAPGQLFGGEGTFGNGAAMRVAPVGAYFADDLDAVVEHARRSAVVTHTHPEAIAGAIAVAVATAWAWRLRGTAVPTLPEFLDRVLPLIPDSDVATKVRQARELAPATPLPNVVAVLGNGSRVTAQDTVPFVLWSAARHLGNYEDALWRTVSGLGDMDTTCAMVGGIVVTYTGVEGIPMELRRNREPLPI